MQNEAVERAIRRHLHIFQLLQQLMSIDAPLLPSFVPYFWFIASFPTYKIDWLLYALKGKHLDPDSLSPARSSPIRPRMCW